MNEQRSEKSGLDYAKGAYKNFKIVKFLLSLLSSKALLILGLLFILLIIIMGMFISGSSTSDPNSEFSGEMEYSNLSETTLQWLDAVTAEANKQDVPDLIPYIMAIIEVESKGTGTADIMQSSESAGLGPNGFSDPLKSIEQGISYLKNGMVIGERISNDIPDYLGIIQGYNFGMAYVSHLVNNNKKHSVQVAEGYSRDIVAPSLGNHFGTTYPYVNNVSTAYGQKYLYRNGGNYFYADLVKQYLVVGSSDSPLGFSTYNTVMSEALKYNGDAYVWAGSNPSTGFDCSGLMQWVFAKAGISLPRTAIEQYKFTDPIPISEAKPGDLIFFQGTYGSPQHISHVGIYIDETRMYDANSSGVGYHYWSEGYWQKHFTSIHRIKQ